MYEGVIFITGKGLGYVTLPSFADDIEIKSEFLKNAWNKDTVLISLFKAPKKRGERQQGKVEKILTTPFPLEKLTRIDLKSEFISPMFHFMSEKKRKWTEKLEKEDFRSICQTGQSRCFHQCFPTDFAV